MEGRAATLLLLTLAAFGTLNAAQSLTEEALTMQGQHWVMLIVVLVAGYVAGRMFPQPARMFGLP